MFKPVIIRDTADLFQRDTSEAFKQLLNIPLVNGVLIEDITFAAVTIRIPHLLNRPFKGYIVVKQNADATLWVDSTLKSELDTYIPLKSSAPVTVTLWVF